MNTFKSHYCQEGEQREISLAVFARFCRFSKGAFYRKSRISMGRNGRLKFQFHCFDIQGPGFFSNAGRFY